MRCADGETHSVFENDGEEICDGIRAGRDAEEDHGEAPDLEVEARRRPKLEVEWYRIGVVTVLVDAADHIVAFLLG